MKFDQQDYLNSAYSMRERKQIKKYFKSLQEDLKKTLDKTFALNKTGSAYDVLAKASEFDAEMAAVSFFERISKNDPADLPSVLMFSFSMHYAVTDYDLEGVDFSPIFLADLANALSGDPSALSEETQEYVSLYYVESMVCSHIAACARARSGISREMIDSLGNTLVNLNPYQPAVCELRTKNIRSKKGQIKYAPAKNIEQDLNAFLEKLAGSFADPFERAAYALCEYTRIHPTVTKTGNVARALMNYCLQEAGFPPLLIIGSLHEEYNEALARYTAEGMNVEPMRMLLRRAIRLLWQEDAYDILAMAEDGSDFGWA